MSIQVSIVIPTVDEKAVREVLHQICQCCSSADLAEILLVTSKSSPADYRAFLRALQDEVDPAFRVCCMEQQGSGLGDALYSGYTRACGTHVIALASDMENDPQDVARLIALAKERPDWIITASRRAAPNGFEAYPAGKRLLNDLFQMLLRVLFSSRQTDITYMFQCVPKSVLERYAFQPDHKAFVLELALLPELTGTPFLEIPSAVGRRKEGRSRTGVRYYSSYLQTAVCLFIKNAGRKSR